MPLYSIKSNTERINKPDAAVYDFLIDFNHFKDLLPADKITNWECTEDTCSFLVIGIISIKLHIADKTPHSFVSYKSSAGSKYPFNFSISINSVDKNSCDCIIKMDYEINSVINGMAEKSLSALVNKMAEKLNLIF